MFAGCICQALKARQNSSISSLCPFCLFHQDDPQEFARFLDRYYDDIRNERKVDRVDIDMVVLSCLNDFWLKSEALARCSAK